MSLSVLFATSELFPLVKTGGLADVSSALPVALKEQGLAVSIIVPGYRSLLKKLKSAPTKTYIPADNFLFDDVQIQQHRLPGTEIDLFVVCSEQLYDRDGGPYQNHDNLDWPDNAIRFTQFCRAIVAVAKQQNVSLIHCNDWQTALVPALLKQEGSAIKSILTIHNMGYQGQYDASVFHQLSLPEDWWHWEKFEFYGNFCFLKGGIQFADKVTTVSPTYAVEVLTEPAGCGLSGVLQARSTDFSGILNGVDYNHWNPATDPHLAAQYDESCLDKKAINKQELQITASLEQSRPTLLVGFVGRLVYQKGVDWLCDAIAHFGTKIQWVVLGAGEPAYELRLQQLSEAFPNQVYFYRGYSEPLAHQIEAGVDLFVMPSRYEPCGLNQIYSMAYGTLPAVRATGGLKDTVDDDVTGFVFDHPDSGGLIYAINQALAKYPNEDDWRQMQINAMEKNFDWSLAATKYLDVYQSV